MLKTLHPLFIAEHPRPRSGGSSLLLYDLPAAALRRMLAICVAALALAVVFTPFLPLTGAKAASCFLSPNDTNSLANATIGVTTTSDGNPTNLACGNNSAAFATGGDYATAVGDETIARGGGATAIGGRSQADAAGTTAIGSGSQALATDSVAIGRGATVTAIRNTGETNNSVALGAGSVADQNLTVSVGNSTFRRRIVNVEGALNDTDATNLGQVNNLIANHIGEGRSAVETGVAIGDFSQATQESASAHGYSATASGVQSTAIGANTQASGTNSTAIGTGAVARRDNEVVIGTTNETYSMPGLTSSHSKSRQSGPVEIVTTDSGGNLASATPRQLGLATQSQINDLAEGIATTAALAQPIFLPGQTFAIQANWGNYEDANAVGVTAAGVLAHNLMGQGRGSLVLSGGVGFGANEGAVTSRVGVGFGW